MSGELPQAVAKFFEAHSELVSGLIADCTSSGSEATALKFSMDGKLVGDIGEWIAVRHFGMTIERTNQKGADGKIGEKLVEVKMTLRGDGAAFRYIPAEYRSSGLLVFKISTDGRKYETVYNGPHERAVERLYQRWESGEVKQSTQCIVRLSELRTKQAELSGPLFVSNESQT